MYSPKNTKRSMNSTRRVSVSPSTNATVLFMTETNKGTATSIDQKRKSLRALCGRYYCILSDPRDFRAAINRMKRRLFPRDMSTPGETNLSSMGRETKRPNSSGRLRLLVSSTDPSALSRYVFLNWDNGRPYRLFLYEAATGSCDSVCLLRRGSVCRFSRLSPLLLAGRRSVGDDGFVAAAEPQGQRNLLGGKDNAEIRCKRVAVKWEQSACQALDLQSSD